MSLFRFLGQSSKPPAWDAAFTVGEKEFHEAAAGTIELQRNLPDFECQTETSGVAGDHERRCGCWYHRTEIASGTFPFEVWLL